MSTRAELLSTLRQLQPELRARFGVVGLGLFGSHARGDATEASDIDLLVRFAPEAEPTLFTLSDLDDLLFEKLGVRVDAIPESCLNPRIAPAIAQDLVEV